MVVEFLQVNPAVDVEGSLGVDGVAKGRTTCSLCSTFPCVVGSICTICGSPVEDRNLLERKFVADLCVLIVVERTSEVSQAQLYRVFPSLIAIGIEVLVDLCVRLLDFSLRATLEREVQRLENVPFEREVAVPGPVLAEGGRQGRKVARIVKVAFLQLIVVAVHVCGESDALRRIGKILCLDDVEPLALTLQVLERFPRFPVRTPRIVEAGFPVQLSLIDSCLPFGVL